MTSPAESGWADSALKGEVDWEGMREEAASKAAKDWDRIRSVAPDGWESWKSVKNSIEDIERAREFYHGQKGIQAIRKAELGFWDNDRFLIDRETYTQMARNSAAVPFAFVKDGQWVERGEMGWFGVVLNEVDEQWRKEFNQMLDSLPDDTLISVVDCHI